MPLKRRILVVDDEEKISEKMLPKHRILVVDDEEKIRKSLSGLLEENGYDVMTANNGAECMKLISDQCFDLVILDIIMPEISGIEVLQNIKDRYKDKEVIMITGYADKEKAIATFRIGAYDFVEKPFESGEILNTVSRCLKQQELRKEVERKNRELRESEQRYYNLFENLNDAAFLADTETGYIIDTNKQGEILLGRPLGEIIGMHQSELHPPDKAEEYLQKFRSHIKKGRVVDYDVEVIRKDGSIIPAAVSATTITVGWKKLMLGLFRDITEKKKLEAQLQQAQKMEAVGQLAGGIAHDFNNILTAITGYASILQKRTNDEQLANYINNILLSSEKAAGLTRCLLAFSRKQIINPMPIDLNEIIKRVENILSRLIGEDIELKSMLSDNDLIVQADSGQIEQVLMNLAANARDAMPDGGLLIIETGELELGEDFIKVHAYGTPGRHALLSVTDTGTGMDDMTRKRIFEPFFTTKEVGKGTGLGLAMVYGIIKQHNGYINVYSEPGKGTTFKIYLPLIESDVERTALTEPAVLIGGNEIVLLAEDDTEVRKLTKTVLEEYGYTVIEAEDGEDAMNKFTENKDRLSIIIIDVVMPRKSGKDVYEMAKKIRPDIKALFISGYTANVIHKKGILDKGFNFISKPLLPEDLLRKVREVLDK